jgi:nitronate monooxygenase
MLQASRYSVLPMAGAKLLSYLTLPIVQSPMAGVQDHALAISVALAGGLGSLPCALLSHKAMQDQVSQFRAAVDAPLNTNFFCHTVSKPDPQSEAIWREILQPYFSEYGIDPSDIAEGAARKTFSHDEVDVLEGIRPEVVSFHFGLPDAALLQRVKSWGATIMSSATTVKEALWLEARGADVIIAQGVEAGGHRGMFLSEDISTQLGSFSLLPQIVQRVTVPVIAAGGIATPAGVAAALSLGASAVQLGTVYLLCDETRTTAIHRAAIRSEACEHTALTNVFSGRPARSIVNRVVSELGPINSAAPSFPHAATAITALRTKAEAVGRDDFSSLWCGQNASACREISAFEMTRYLASELKLG